MIDLRGAVPEFVIDQISNSRSSGEFEATAMVVDIVGFSSMAESLLTYGSAGAEELCNRINQLFGRAVDAVYDHGGWVVKYAGDAFISLFPHDTGAADVLRGALAAKNALAESRTIQNDFYTYSLSTRIGLGSGRVSWGIVSTESRNVFYTLGDALSRAYDAEKICSPGEIIVHTSFRERKVLHHLEMINGSFFRITGVDAPIVGKKQTDPIPIQYNDEIVAGCVPQAVLEMHHSGEFRDVACIFLGFPSISSTESIEEHHEFFRHVIDTTEQYGGFLSEIDFGDKGNVFVIYVGAPVARERPVIRAVHLVFELMSMFPEKSLRGGVSYGRVYAGRVGSSARWEYKTVGERVNLAARLMSKAQDGEILVDENAARGMRDRFNMESLGAIPLKGYESGIPVSRVHSRIRFHENIQDSVEYVGREKELSTLQSKIELLNGGGFGGIVYIDGSAGIGKSRLVNEIKERIEIENYTWIELPCDDMIRQSLNPIRHFAAGYFDILGTETKETHENRFNRRFCDLVDTCGDDAIKRELERTHSCLGALVDLAWTDSLYERLDAEGKRRNTFIAVKALLRAEALMKPVIIAVEDGHWLDEDTRDFLSYLVLNIEDYPILLLFLSRPNDDGSPHRIPMPDIPISEIILERLEDKSEHAYIEACLGGMPTLELSTYIASRGEGNPFYLEQLVLYLAESEVLCKNPDGKFDLIPHRLELPSSITALVTSRIDRLSQELRTTISAASVIGREFNVKLLSAVLSKNRVEIGRVLDDGKWQRIWDPLSDLIYMFNHALIRDTAYEMQLSKTIRQLHRLAGEAIEAVFHVDLKPYFGQLAYHFENARIQLKAKDYLLLAAKQAEERFSNADALNFYQRHREYLSEPADYISIDLSIVKLLVRTGKWNEAEKLVRSCISESRENNLSSIYRESLNALGNVLIRLGRFDEALSLYEEHMALCKEAGDTRGMSIACSNVGRIFRLQGDFSTALEYFRKDLKICVEMNDRKGIGYTLGNMGSIYGSIEDLHRARICFSKSLEISEECDDKFGISMSVGSIGLVNLVEHKYDEALLCFQRQLAVAMELGDQFSIGYATGNLGTLHAKKGEFETAVDQLKEKLQISKEMGYQQGVCIALFELGRVSKATGHIEAALRYVDEAITLGRKLKLMDYVCGFLKEKAELMLLSGRIAELEKIESINDEASEIAEHVGKSDVIFGAKLLKARITAARGNIEEATEALMEVADQHPDEIKQASIYYTITGITGDHEYRQKARNLYERLYENIPDYEFKCRIEEMKSAQTT